MLLWQVRFNKAWKKIQEMQKKSRSTKFFLFSRNWSSHWMIYLFTRVPYVFFLFRYHWISKEKTHCELLKLATWPEKWKIVQKKKHMTATFVQKDLTIWQTLKFIRGGTQVSCLINVRFVVKVTGTHRVWSFTIRTYTRKIWKF